MVGIELHFPAGRYHATPWGRNVNEGVPEWPPSPFRLARALADASFRKRPDWSQKRLWNVIEIIASPFSYRLPPVTTSHVRTYLSENLKDISKKQKVFDAFIAIKKQDPVLIAFDAEPAREALYDLKTLLGFMNYLGRSESWVSAKVLNNVHPDFNCITSSLPGSQAVDICCLKSPAEYELFKNDLQEEGEHALNGFNWIEAVCMGTDYLQREGWSSPPAMKRETYFIGNSLIDSAQSVLQHQRRCFSRAVYSVTGKILPLVTETLPLAERVRRKLMGIHRKLMGEDPAGISQTFSGKDSDGKYIKGHSHAFYLPMDFDGDGRIDSLSITTSGIFDMKELKALDLLRTIWQEGGRPDLNLVLSDLTVKTKPIKATRWISSTPFVTTRHYRKGRGEYGEWLEKELIRELGYHGISDPIEIEPITGTQSSGHRFMWLEFTRSRKGDMPLRGYGFKICFENPVDGPFAVGALCHFGLGQFIPE